MKTYVFPGQGSQAKGMGEGIFQLFPDLVKKADAILGYSIRALCLDNPEGKLRFTQYTQPALYVVNALTYLKQLKEGNPKPDFLVGHSLGEYNAILAAGGFDFETGLQLVKKRGELMSQASGGAMAAVVGLTEDQIKALLVNNKLTEIDIANLNTTTQIVISGHKDDIDRAKHYFEREGADYIPLNVSAAFHSRHMQEAKDEFEHYLKKFSYSELTIPVISNVTARPYNPAAIVPNLAEQLRSSVRWTESIRYLIRQGEMEFEELGPGSVLTKIIAKIKVEASATQQSVSIGAKVTNSFDRKDDYTEGQAEFKRKIDTAYQQTADWNQAYPIGAKVTCKGYKDVLITRTEAMVLFGHRAAIYMEGYNGYFSLDDLTTV